jgi:hypothetical protein
MPTPHPAALDSEYGRVATAPLARARFTLPGAQPVTVTPMDGTLTWDAGEWPRTTLRLTLPTTITPTLLPAAVSAYGGRVTLTMGRTYRDRVETFTAATLAVAQVDVSRPDGQVRILATSYEALVNEDRYDTATDSDAGDLRDVVTAMVRRTLPDVQVVDQLGAVGSTILPEGAYSLAGDVWPSIERIMDDHGAEAWFDALGRLVLRLVPTPATTPNLTIRVGGDGGTLTGYDSTRRWGPNRVSLVYSTPPYEGRTRHQFTDVTTGTSPGMVGVNNANPAAATLVRVHRQDLDGTDVADQFAGLVAGDRVRLVDDSATLPKPSRVVYRVTAPPTLTASVVSIPVQVVRAVKAPTAPPLFPVDTDLDVLVTINPRRRVGLWEDTSATSPTRVAGPYGRHTYREDLSVDRGELPSQAEADAAALAMARRVVGRLRGVSVRAVPAPWLLPGDTVRLTMLGGLTEDHVVQAVEHPVTGLDVMTLTTRDAAYTGGPF